MVKTAEIQDETKLRAWLQDQPREVAVWIAARAAARVLPIWWHAALAEKWARKHDLSALPILRSLLISLVDVRLPAEEMKKAVFDRSYAGKAPHSVYVAADSAYDAYLAVAATDGDAAAVHAAAAAGDAATGATSHSYAITAANTLWVEVKTDAERVEASGVSADIPLWSGEPPEELGQLWGMTLSRLEELEEAGKWAFWGQWYEALLDGRPMLGDPKRTEEMLERIALIDPFVWDKGPEAANPVIEGIWREYQIDGQATPLSQAGYFDFVEANRVMRAVGFPSDLPVFRSPEEQQGFISEMKDLRDDLLDWCDYAAEANHGDNNSHPIKRAVEKLLEQFEKIECGESVTLRRFVAIGSDLRRLSLDPSYRGKLSSSLAEMLDERYDRYAEISHQYLGAVFAALEPLASLELGEHDSADLIARIRAALRRIEDVPESQLRPLSVEAEAVLRDLLRELEEIDAEIQGADEAHRGLLQKRFAERYGAYSATYGRYIERATEVVSDAGKRFDQAVKWYKRWETIDKIRDWWDMLGPGAGQ